MISDTCILSGTFANCDHSCIIHIWSANLISRYNQLKIKWYLAFSLERFGTASVKTLPFIAHVHVCSSNNNLHQGCCCDNRPFVFNETQDVVWHNPRCSNRIADFFSRWRHIAVVVDNSSHSLVSHKLILAAICTRQRSCIPGLLVFKGGRMPYLMPVLVF